MSEFILKLLFSASISGTVLWIGLVLLRTFLKSFSQKWIYLFFLIPLGFFLGIGTILSLLIGKTDRTFPYSVSPFLENASLIEGESVPNIIPIAPILITIWIMGMTVFFAVSLRAYFKFRKKIFNNAKITYPSSQPIPVVISSQITSPMLFGLFSPVILIPEYLKESEYLPWILQHESIHWKQKDIWIKWLMLLACGIHWFNPVIWHFRQELNQQCELSCDEALVKNLSKQERYCYGNMILTVLEQGISTSNSLTAPLCSPMKQMKRRLICMMNSKQTSLRNKMMAVTLTAALFGFGAMTAYASAPAENQTPVQRISANSVEAEDTRDDYFYRMNRRVERNQDDDYDYGYCRRGENGNGRYCRGNFENGGRGGRCGRGYSSWDR